MGKRFLNGLVTGAGFVAIVAVAFAIAWAGDILTVDKDGTVHFRIADSGSVGIPNVPDTSALLDLSSTSKGFLMPRLTTAQRDAIASPAVGLEIYNATTNRAERYTGTAWKPVGISNVGVRVYHSANQSVSNDTITPLSLNAERYDTDSIHDLAVNNTRLTAKTAGKYLITGNVVFISNATGVRDIMVRLNGTTRIAEVLSNSVVSSGTVVSIATIYDLVANDYVELCAYQNSGGNLDVVAMGAVSPEFSMVLLQE